MSILVTSAEISLKICLTLGNEIKENANELAVKMIGLHRYTCMQHLCNALVILCYKKMYHCG